MWGIDCQTIYQLQLCLSAHFVYFSSKTLAFSFLCQTLLCIRHAAWLHSPLPSPWSCLPERQLSCLCWWIFLPSFVLALYWQKSEGRNHQFTEIYRSQVLRVANDCSLENAEPRFYCSASFLNGLLKMILRLHSSISLKNIFINEPPLPNHYWSTSNRNIWSFNVIIT